MCLPPPASNQALVQCCKVSLVLSPPSAPHTAVSMNPFTWRKHFSESSNNSQARNFLSQPPNPHHPLPTRKASRSDGEHTKPNRNTFPSPIREQAHAHQPETVAPNQLLLSFPHSTLHFFEIARKCEALSKKGIQPPFLLSGFSVSFAYARKPGGRMGGMSGI